MVSLTQSFFRRLTELFTLLLLLCQSSALKADELQTQFDSKVLPVLRNHCFDCHNVDDRESGVRLDHLDGSLPDGAIKLWEHVGKQIESGAMPPEDHSEIPEQQRRELLSWLEASLHQARIREAPNNGITRRLTVTQYRHALQELLGIDDDFTATLPDDGISKDGFTNDSETLSASPLQIEAWFNIATQALEASTVDPTVSPTVQNFRMDLGRGINPQPLQENLILGALNRLLPKQDFTVTELTPEKSFPIQAYRLPAKYRFNEGYSGNATVRGWREYASIYHKVFACLRGDGGYPKGEPYESVDNGLLLRPAIPNDSVWQRSTTYGPKANFKIALRELPRHGRFRVTVRAAKFDDALLLSNLNAEPAEQASPQESVTMSAEQKDQPLVIPQSGIYQVDVYRRPKTEDEKGNERFSLQIDGRRFTDQLKRTPAMLLRLAEGERDWSFDFGRGDAAIEKIVLTRLSMDDPLAQRYETFMQQSPWLGVYMGLRRDCGHTFNQVESSRVVDQLSTQAFVFEGAINNFPRPDVQPGNDNYLAGLREILVHSVYTDGRDRPRLRIETIEFEGPLYESWPPQSHRNVFSVGPEVTDELERARETIRRFAQRAFRRPVDLQEMAGLMELWREHYQQSKDFHASTRYVLAGILTSPAFLFHVENSQSPKPEPLNQHELAAKLALFLWDGPPDQELTDVANRGQLTAELDKTIDRMIADPKFERFTETFVRQWLSLDKFDSVEVDRRKYPALSKFARKHLRQEPVRTFQHLVRTNQSVGKLIQSDEMVINETLAKYYGIDQPIESGPEFVAVSVDLSHLGGLLTQAAIQSGLSDGREANPVKRGAWFARKIIAEPPNDPPPNVPELKDDRSLPLKERLRQHRDVKGCVKCHEGIDPWGVAFQQYDAGGLFTGNKADAKSKLPDGVEVDGVAELQQHLLQNRLADVAFSVQKHLITYAIGRPLQYNEWVRLKENGLAGVDEDYRLQDMIRAIVHSDYFLKK